MSQLIATDVPEYERFGNIVRQHAKQREKAATDRESQAISLAYGQSVPCVSDGTELGVRFDGECGCLLCATDRLLNQIDLGVSVGQRWRQLQVVEGLLRGLDG